VLPLLLLLTLLLLLSPLAGPGSGKTRVLAARVEHLLKQGVGPGSILAIHSFHQLGEEGA
jgi:hypothetical protein